MTASRFNNIRVYNAEQFKKSLTGTPSANLYFTYGKATGWANDSVPPQANSSIDTVYEVWKNMIGGKRILGGDVTLGIRRNIWESNTNYTAYDNRSENLYDDNVKFYIVNSENSVYKCLANNNGQPSTVEPTSINPEIVTSTSDGYIWKYMYTVSDSEILRFTTDDYIPVKTLTGNDGSSQWQVQEASAEGEIYSIYISNSGTGYTNASNITITITGDGTDATAIASINATSQTISSIIMSNYGVGYTYANVVISDSGTGTGASAIAVITPERGHGANPIYELGAGVAIINARLKYDENGYFPTSNDMRQVSLIVNPYLRGTSNTTSNIAFLEAQTIYTTGIGNYLDDEIVYQGSSVESSTYTARVLKWDAPNNKVIVINTTGTIQAQSLIGANSFTSRFVTSDVQEGEFEPYSGTLLYVDNIQPIIRAADQTEDFKIVLKF